MPPAQRPYHHGNLKDALLDAAVALIGEVGPNAFTLREVARRAGVSHNAPYRHFRDKEELLAAVATQGFQRLTAALRDSMAPGPTAADRFRLSGQGYVRFALDHPQHLQVMFDFPQAGTEAAYEAFQTLLDAVIAVQQEGSLPPGDPQPYAIAAWSAVHGLAKLAIARHLPFTQAETLAFTDWLTAALQRGLRQKP